MDGITVTLLGALTSSQFLIYYKLGRVEERLKRIENQVKLR